MAFLGVHFGVLITDREDFLSFHKSLWSEQHLCFVNPGRDFGDGTLRRRMDLQFSSGFLFVSISGILFGFIRNRGVHAAPTSRPNSELMVFAERREESRKHPSKVTRPIYRYKQNNRTFDFHHTTL